MMISSRRGVLAGALAGAALAGVPRAFAAPNLDPVRVYTQLRARLDGSLTMGLYTGVYWGKPAGDIAVKLFRVDGFNFQRMTRTPDGGVRQILEEVGFWQDPDTGELLDTWINPINGLECKVEHFRSKQDLVFGPKGNLITPDPLPARFKHYVGTISEPVVSGDTVWSKESLIVKAVSPDPEPGQDPLTYRGPLITSTSLATFTARVSDLSDDPTVFVPATMNYQTMGPWYPWFRLGQLPGAASFQLMGHKVQSLDEVPDRLRKMVETRHPGFINGPDF